MVKSQLWPFTANTYQHVESDEPEDDLEPEDGMQHEDGEVSERKHGETLDDAAAARRSLLRRRRRWRSPAWPYIALACFFMLIVAVGVMLWRSKQTRLAAPRKALVIAGYQAQDRSWYPSIPKDWETFDYRVDDPLHVPSTPREQGYESMVYLSFIIDNYDRLPDYMVFVHGHNKAWHQPEPMSYMLQALNLGAVDEHGWVSLRCQLEAMCEPESTRANMSYLLQQLPPGKETFGHYKLNLMRELVRYVFREQDPWFDGSDYDAAIGTPAFFASPCCAQFAVSRHQVLRRPREYWLRVREPLMKDLDSLHRVWNLPDTHPADWWLGVAYETLWHYFFGMPAVTCLQREYCRNVVFQNRIHCDGHTTRPSVSHHAYENITCTLDDALPGTEYLGAPIEPAGFSALR